LKTGLVEEIGGAQQVVGEVVAGFAAGKSKPAIWRVSVALVDLDVANVGAKFEGVSVPYFREIITDLIGVVVLTGNARNPGACTCTE